MSAFSFEARLDIISRAFGGRLPGDGAVFGPGGPLERRTDPDQWMLKSAVLMLKVRGYGRNLLIWTAIGAIGLLLPVHGMAADAGQVDATSTATSSVSLTIPERVTFAIETVTEIDTETGELSLAVIGGEFDQFLISFALVLGCMRSLR